MREVDGWLRDFTGQPSDLLPDDLRFAWWEWFDTGRSPEQAAEAVVEILSGDEAERTRLAAERIA